MTTATKVPTTLLLGETSTGFPEIRAIVSTEENKPLAVDVLETLARTVTANCYIHRLLDNRGNHYINSPSKRDISKSVGILENAMKYLKGQLSGYDLEIAESILQTLDDWFKTTAGSATLRNYRSFTISFLDLSRSDVLVVTIKPIPVNDLNRHVDDILKLRVGLSIDSDGNFHELPKRTSKCREILSLLILTAPQAATAEVLEDKKTLRFSNTGLVDDHLTVDKEAIAVINLYVKMHLLAWLSCPMNEHEVLAFEDCYEQIGERFDLLETSNREFALSVMRAINDLEALKRVAFHSLKNPVFAQVKEGILIQSSTEGK